MGSLSLKEEYIIKEIKSLLRLKKTKLDCS